MMRMKKDVLRRMFFGVVLSAVLSPTSLTAQDVNTDYDHHTEFSRYHSFSFSKVQSSDPLFESRIKDAVTRDLTAKGWQQVPTGGDVAITAIGNVRSEQEYNTFYDGLGGGGFGWRGWRGWGGGWGGETNATTTVTRVPVGTLMVDMYDSGTHQLIWRGSAQDELSNKADKNTKKLEKAVDKMFDKFPPKGAR